MNGNASGPLGWIRPQDRTQEQADAHAAAMAAMPRFALQAPAVPKGAKVILTDFWSKPEVVADVGFVFNGFYQFTGSCVGVSDGNAVFTLSAVQRMLSDNPTKAFVPFWPFAYGRTRYLEGDRGRGEGAVDSVMGTQNGTEGILDTTPAGLPKFNVTNDGIQLSQSVEMQWSDGAGPATQYMAQAKPNLVGTRAPIFDTEGIKAANLNGYPVLYGNDGYIGHASIQGSGAEACTVGRHDSQGGHSTCYLGWWDHPTLGPLFLMSNQWATQTYPKDPAGGGRCCCWEKEADVARIFRTGSDQGETMALSHLNYFPAQPKLLDWLI